MFPELEELRKALGSERVEPLIVISITKDKYLMMLTSAEDISLRNRETNVEFIQMKNYQDLPLQCPGPIMLNITVDRDKSLNLTGKKESSQFEKVMKNQLSSNKDMIKKCLNMPKIIGRLKYDYNVNKDLNKSLSQSMNKIKKF